MSKQMEFEEDEELSSPSTSSGSSTNYLNTNSASTPGTATLNPDDNFNSRQSATCLKLRFSSNRKRAYVKVDAPTEANNAKFLKSNINGNSKDNDAQNDSKTLSDNLSPSNFQFTNLKPNLIVDSIMEHYVAGSGKSDISYETKQCSVSLLKEQTAIKIYDPICTKSSPSDDGYSSSPVSFSTECGKMLSAIEDYYFQDQEELEYAVLLQKLKLDDPIEEDIGEEYVTAGSKLSPVLLKSESESSYNMTKNYEKPPSCLDIDTVLNSDVSNSTEYKGWKTEFKQPSETWECPSCMIYIKNKIKTCPICLGDKPKW